MKKIIMILLALALFASSCVTAYNPHSRGYNKSGSKKYQKQGLHGDTNNRGMAATGTYDCGKKRK